MSRCGTGVEIRPAQRFVLPSGRPGYIFPAYPLYKMPKPFFAPFKSIPLVAIPPSTSCNEKTPADRVIAGAGRLVSE